MPDNWTEADQALDIFRTNAWSLIMDDFRVAQGSVPYQPAIYHYTDVKGALGILQSGRIWFTCRHLNDPMEIRYGLDVGRECSEIATKTRGAAIPKDAALHLKGEHEFALATYGFWIASFSVDGNDLVQWRNYADEGRGICLGFSTDAFNMGIASTTPTRRSVRLGTPADDIPVPAECSFPALLERDFEVAPGS
jgi:hypothetical protein